MKLARIVLCMLASSFTSKADHFQWMVTFVNHFFFSSSSSQLDNDKASKFISFLLTFLALQPLGFWSCPDLWGVCLAAWVMPFMQFALAATSSKWNSCKKLLNRSFVSLHKRTFYGNVWHNCVSESGSFYQKKKVTRYKAKQFKQEVLVFVDSTSSDIQDEVWCSRLQF